jgi:hypothetical protein
MFTNLLRSWTKSEVWSALIGIISLVVSLVANFKSNARAETLLVLTVGAALICVWFLFLITRSAFAIRGYSNAMSYLQTLAETSKYSIWTARTHLGEGVGEEKYFDIIEHRLKDPHRPLEDFRRIIRFCPQSCGHIRSLFARLSEQAGVEVRYYTAGGPQFDFMIVDHTVAVIGFPMVGGKGNVGAIVLRGRPAVHGVETVFQEFWNQSHSLFEGSKNRSFEETKQLESQVNALLSGTEQTVVPPRAFPESDVRIPIEDLPAQTR